LLAGSFLSCWQFGGFGRSGCLRSGSFGWREPIRSVRHLKCTAGQASVSKYVDGIEADGAMRLKRNDGMIDIIRAGDVSPG
jgi:hypothetical protein